MDGREHDWCDSVGILDEDLFVDPLRGESREDALLRLDKQLEQMRAVGELCASIRNLDRHLDMTGGEGQDWRRVSAEALRLVDVLEGKV